MNPVDERIFAWKDILRRRSALPPAFSICPIRRDVNMPAMKSPAKVKARILSMKKWIEYSQKPESIKKRATHRLLVLSEVRNALAYGLSVSMAFRVAALSYDEKEANIRNWYYGSRGRIGVRCVPYKDWLPHLAPGHKGRPELAACSTKAWEFLLQYIQENQGKSFTKCFQALQQAASDNGWTIPSEQTLRRRLKKRQNAA